MKQENKRVWPVWLALFAYSAFLVFFLRAQDDTPPTLIALFRLQSLREAYDWLIDSSLKALLDIARFVPVGFLIPLALPQVTSRLTRLFLVAVPSLLLSIVLSGALLGFGLGYPWQMPGSLDVVLLAIGCVLGTWIGMSWLRGPRARLWILPKLAMAIILLCGGLLALLLLTMEQEPLPFQTADITSAGKRELVKLFRRGGEAVPEREPTERFTLTKANMNALLAWAMSLGPGAKKAKVELGQEKGSLFVSIGVPITAEERRYINWTTGVGGRVKNGELDLHVDALCLGRLDAPGWFLSFLSPVVKATVSHGRRIKPILDATDELSVTPENIEIYYTDVDLPRKILPYLLAGMNASEDVRRAIRAQIRHMAESAAQLPSGDARVGACLESAFAYAQYRSSDGGPVIQNTGAVLALGILLGHPSLENFIGPIAGDRVILRTRHALGDVTLRGRSDWAKHFFLSAGLALLSNETLSDAAGVLKEELDAEAGGSGFSFADLLADRSGTTFALMATRSEKSATALQQRLATGFEIDAFFPQAADLPEGIPDSELQSSYGGVGGREYNRIAAEIERRVKNCAAYR